MSSKKESQQVTFESIGVHADVCAALTDRGITHPFELQRKALLHTVNDFADVIAESPAHSGRHSLLAIFAVHCVLSSEAKSNVVIVANNAAAAAKIIHTLQSLLAATRVVAVPCLDERPHKVPTSTASGQAIAGTVFVGTLGVFSKWTPENFSNTVTLVVEDCFTHDAKPLQSAIETVIQRSPSTNLFFLSSRAPSEVSVSIRYLLRRKNRRYYFQANASARFSYLMCHDAADREALCMQVAQLKGLKSVLILTHNKEVRDLKANLHQDLGVKSFCIQRNTQPQDHDRTLSEFLRSPFAALVAMDAYPGVDVMDLDAIIQYYPPQKSMPEDEWAEYVSYLQTTCDPRRPTTVVTLVAPDDFSLVQYFMKRVGAEGPVINISPTHPLLSAAVFHPEIIMQEKMRIESARGSSKSRSPVAASTVPLPRSQRSDGGKGGSNPGSVPPPPPPPPPLPAHVQSSKVTSNTSAPLAAVAADNSNGNKTKGQQNQNQGNQGNQGSAAASSGSGRGQGGNNGNGQKKGDNGNGGQSKGGASASNTNAQPVVAAAKESHSAAPGEERRDAEGSKERDGGRRRRR